MRGGRVIVVAGVVMGVVAGVLVILMMMKGGNQTPAVSPTPEPPSVVRAAQNIAKGSEIPLDAIQLVRLDAGEPAPPDAVEDPVSVAGMTAAMDIPQGTVIQEEMFFDKELAAEEGTAASTLFQPGRVAMAIRVGDLSGVAGAIRAGDHVDIIAALEFVDVDSEVQAVLPLDGSVDQRPGLVTQLTLQNLEVLRVGKWGTGPDAGTAEETPVNDGLLTLLMPQQEALVLEWLLVKYAEGEAHFAMVLRSQDDDEIVTTDAVTLDYLMKRYKIIAPPNTPISTMPVEVQGDIEPN
ncbi:MAG: Flp pilus assembly protein CpaB [Anaerolineae bacterium]